MTGAADAANPRGDHQAVQGTAADQHGFDPPVHGPDHPGIGHHPVFNGDLDLQIPFNPIHWHTYCFCHAISFSGSDP